MKIALVIAVALGGFAFAQSNGASSVDETNSALVTDTTAGLLGQLIAQGIVDPNTADVDITAADAGLPAPYKVEATTTDPMKFLPAAENVVQTAQVQEAEGAVLAAHGTCVDKATGSQGAWTANLTMRGPRLQGTVVLSTAGNETSIAVAGTMQANAVTLSLADPTGLLGSFSGTVGASLVSGLYTFGWSSGTCVGGLG